MSAPVPPSDPVAAPVARSSPRRARRRWLLPAIAAAVAIVAVLAGLYASGALTPSTSGGPGPTDETFFEASARAESASSSVAGGPWYLFAGLAAIAPTAVLEPLTNLSNETGLTNCVFAWPNGVPANLAVPATGADAGLGESAFWAFALKNVSNAVLVETVAAGVAAAVVTVGGGECGSLAGDAVTFPSNELDSPALLGAANVAGGSAFLDSHPNATQLWLGFGGFSAYGLTTTPEWYVTYTSCALPLSIDSSGEFFNATLEGTTAVVVNQSAGPAGCVPSIPTSLGSLVPVAVGGAVPVRKAI